MIPTPELRFERRAYEKSTMPDDFMKAIIGKQYPTITAYTLVLQQKWTNSEDAWIPVSEWRDVPIVDEPVKEKPKDAMQEAIEKQLASMTDEQKKKMADDCAAAIEAKQSLIPKDK